MDSLKKAYLIIYNGIQTFGWAIVLVQTIFHLLTRGTLHNLYDHTYHLLCIFQTLALLEVVHAATGIVRSNFLLTAMQVASRQFLTWGILFLVPESRKSYGLVFVLFAWSITEVVRYSFYAFQLIGAVPAALQWCRYSFFLLLYPAGVFGELWCVFKAIDPICRAGLYSLTLPNRANLSFSYCVCVYLVVLTYIPCFPQLFGHMLTQRKKVLSVQTQPLEARKDR